jgi:hypothetical protein
VKRPFFILFAGITAAVLILVFRPKQSTINEPIVASKSLYTNTAADLETTNSSSAKIATQAPAPAVAQVEPKKILDAIKAQSLADWTNTIPNIKQWSHFRGRSSWVADQRDANHYPVILLTGANGKTIQYKAKLTSVDAMGDYVREIELQSGWVDITDVRSLGDSLLQMMGMDETGFNSWSDKVENNWVDAPLYNSPVSQVPNSSKYYGFQILRSYNNDKPWSINFIITDK